MAVGPGRAESVLAAAWRRPLETLGVIGAIGGALFAAIYGVIPGHESSLPAIWERFLRDAIVNGSPVLSNSPQLSAKSETIFQFKNNYSVSALNFATAGKDKAGIEAWITDELKDQKSITPRFTDGGDLSFVIARDGDQYALWAFRPDLGGNPKIVNGKPDVITVISGTRSVATQTAAALNAMVNGRVADGKQLPPDIGRLTWVVEHPDDQDSKKFMDAFQRAVSRQR